MRSTYFRKGVFVLFFISAVSFATLPARAQKGPGEGSAGVAESSNLFAFDLYRQLSQSEEGNIFFSPFSITSALGMAYAGAGGDTRSQMALVLHFQGEPGGVHAGFSSLQESLYAVQLSGAVELNTANALWAQSGYDFKDGYLDLTTRHYASAVFQVDFRQSADPARLTINDWVEEKTRGKVEDLLSPGSVNEMTRLVLTNAVYFKGNWRFPFEPAVTGDASFRVDGQTAVTVPMMRQTREFGYFEDHAVQVLRMPYVDPSLAMVVVLPKDKDGIADLEKDLNVDHLDEWLGGLDTKKVRVFLPRFTVEDKFFLADTLMKMGMRDAFRPGDADFSGMADTRESLFISQVVHKAFVDVTERGTEAAAATAVAVMGGLAVAPEEPPVFRADHPFVFFILHRDSRIVLFMGKVKYPQKK